ncbi:alpha-ketoglutarate-dependent dioxygenase AlkB [Glaciecola sp. MH2013]|uniref:alpha-ketoglutarate-dependent dioxygenase AlkB family protein n=1 Tax=Glaciecola sp. MH2013 TaxID=2785524 RepID=UPI0018A12697|nr:alpha-ketoglutarate-dependent dioxygenase AlkB [Glaciecola sp. MH2013]MBF7071897.1 alpha-ketoglutarate-dependent dioxygenase AlkB [Glaciecola sp. MH2013]
MQKSLFPQNELQSLPLADAKVHYLENWLDESQSKYFFQSLHNSLDWSEGFIKLFGKTHKIPRLQAWYGDPGTDYAYSGETMKSLNWTHQLLKLKNLAEQISGKRFNSVLANLYRDGSDGMGMHSDDEPELGHTPTIASVSLGETRRFDFKHKISGEKYSIQLRNGSLLLMSGQTQRYWLHGIAKTTKVHAPRINLTFRHIIKK